MPNVQDFVQAIAAARPQMIHSGGGQRMIGPVKETRKEGYGQMGYEFGRGVGSEIESYINFWSPTSVRERADKLRSAFANMSEEDQELIYSDPNVQNMLKRMYKHAPDLIAKTPDKVIRGPHGETGGMPGRYELARFKVAPHELEMAQARKVSAETELLEGPLTDQEIAKAGIYNIELGDLKAAQKLGLPLKERQAKLAAVRAEIRLNEARASAEEQTLPLQIKKLESDLLLAQEQIKNMAANFRLTMAQEYSIYEDMKLRRDQFNQDVKQKMETEMDETVRDLANKWKFEDDRTVKDYLGAYEMKVAPWNYTLRSLDNAINNMAGGLAPGKVQGQGLDSPLAQSIINTAYADGVNTYMKLTGPDVIDEISADQAMMVYSIFEKIDALYNQSYGKYITRRDKAINAGDATPWMPPRWEEMQRIMAWLTLHADANRFIKPLGEKVRAELDKLLWYNDPNTKERLKFDLAVDKTVISAHSPTETWLQKYFGKTPQGLLKLAPGETGQTVNPPKTEIGGLE